MIYPVSRLFYPEMERFDSRGHPSHDSRFAIRPTWSGCTNVSGLDPLGVSTASLGGASCKQPCTPCPYNNTRKSLNSLS